MTLAHPPVGEGLEFLSRRALAHARDDARCPRGHTSRVVTEAFQDPSALLARAPLISADEEDALGARALAGDVVARNALVSANVRLAMKIAHGFKNRGLPIEDLIQESIIGLVTAAQKFDPARGCRFSTYASWWIRQSIMDAINTTARTIRLPQQIGTAIGRENAVRSV